MANKFDHDIWIVDTLAQGPSYWSHVAYWPEEDQKVLLKHVNPNCSAEQKEKIEERLLKEASILEEFWSVYFPKVYDIRRKEETGELYILSEFFSGETLDRFIEKSPEKALTAKFYLHLYHELKFALSHLHNKKKIIHFDLTPDNVIVDLEFGIHIIDFENSRILGSSLSSSEVRGKEGFLPPEVLEGDKKNIFANAAIDTFALGKILSNLYEKLPTVEKLKLVGKGPDLKTLVHPNPGIRKIESRLPSVPNLSLKPIVTILFLLLSAFTITRLDFDTNKEITKVPSRAPALPRYSRKKIAKKEVKKQRRIIQDQVTSKRSAPKRTEAQAKPKKKKKVVSFKESFLKTIGTRDTELKECLQTFSKAPVRKIKLRYHVLASTHKLAKLEVLNPESLSLNAKICLTSLYKDLNFPPHQSKKSYTIDQSFTFLKVD